MKKIRKKIADIKNNNNEMVRDYERTHFPISFNLFSFRWVLQNNKNTNFEVRCYGNYNF